MVLHVTGARHVLRRDVDDAEQALLDAETVGRSSLDQVRATVAALRDHERGTDPALAGAADIPALVEDYRRAGLTITTEIGARAATIGGPTGTALHRITGEALANVAFHAPGQPGGARAGSHRRGGRLVIADRGRPLGRSIPTDRTSAFSAWSSASGPSVGSSKPVRRPTAGGSRRGLQRQRRQAVTSS